MGVETRQFTGAVAPPSSRLVRIVSIMVPSRMRCRGPSAAVNSGAGTGAGDGAEFIGATVGEAEVVLVRAVDARTTASATSSRDGGAALRSPLMPVVLRRGEALRVGSVVASVGLWTTLLANRLSYSRRRRSSAIGSCAHVEPCSL